MYLQVQMQENGTEKIFRDKQITKKVALIFLDVTELTHMY